MLPEAVGMTGDLDMLSPLLPKAAVQLLVGTAILGALIPRLRRRRAIPIHDLTVGYLQHLRTYVYDLKREAESRARALVTANTLFVAAVGLIINTVTHVHQSKTQALALILVITEVLGVAGAIIAVASLIQAVSVFLPRVVDTTSSMEPLTIESLAADDLTSLHVKYTPATIVSALCREIKAISTVQVKRSAMVRRSTSTFATALMCLAGSACTLMVIFLA